MREQINEYAKEKEKSSMRQPEAEKLKRNHWWFHRHRCLKHEEGEGGSESFG